MCRPTQRGDRRSHRAKRPRPTPVANSCSRRQSCKSTTGPAPLERRGHSAVVAENGREALTAMDKHKFDLVLMDVQMPEMGGLEATRAIREKEQATGQHVPIIAMTAHAMQGDRERCSRREWTDTSPSRWTLRYSNKRWKSMASPQSATEPETAAPINKDAVDADALLERFSGDQKLVRTLVKAFHGDCPGMISRIRRASTARSAAALADAAHAFKGAVGNFGDSVGFETAREIEKLARQGKLDGTRELCQRLEEYGGLSTGTLGSSAREEENKKERPLPAIPAEEKMTRILVADDDRTLACYFPRHFALRNLHDLCGRWRRSTEENE